MTVIFAGLAILGVVVILRTTPEVLFATEVLSVVMLWLAAVLTVVAVLS